MGFAARWALGSGWVDCLVQVAWRRPARRELQRSERPPTPRPAVTTFPGCMVDAVERKGGVNSVKEDHRQAGGELQCCQRASSAAPARVRAGTYETTGITSLAPSSNVQSCRLARAQQRSPPPSRRRRLAARCTGLRCARRREGARRPPVYVTRRGEQRAKLPLYACRAPAPAQAWQPRRKLSRAARCAAAQPYKLAWQRSPETTSRRLRRR